MTAPVEEAAGLLVIVTGGTIGMAPGPHGLAPEAGRVEAALERLRPPSVPLRIVRFDPLIDSAHVDRSHWNEMIRLIESWPGSGVVITHGTDTMAFTGAALAFALAGLGRRVVLCGAMRPLGTDGAAERELAAALANAHAGPPGLWLSSAGRLLPGHALVKRSSVAGDAFVDAGDHDPPPAGAARARHFPERRLAILTLSPGLPAPALGAALAALDGAVLRVYGAGGGPAEGAVIATLAAAVAAGKRIMAVSQCESGGLRPGAYAAGEPLWRAGVEDGGARTPEAALISLWLDGPAPA